MSDQSTPLRVRVYDIHPEYVSIDPSNLRFFYQQFYLHNVGDTLVHYDGRHRLEAGLAEAWKVSPDQSEVKFTLRSNRTFSDGKPLTTRDVAATFMRACLKKSNVHFRIHEYIVGCDKARTLDDSIRGIEVKTDREIILRFTQPITNLLEKIAFTELIILPKGAIDHASLAIDWSVTSGSYFVKSWRNNFVLLEKNPYALQAHPAMPVHVEVLPTTALSSMLQELHHGTLDLFSTVLPMNAEIGSIAHQNSDYAVIANEFVNNNFLIINPTAPRWKSLRKRQELVARLRAIEYNDLPQIIFRKASDIFPEPIGGHSYPDFPSVSFDPTEQMNIEIIIHPKFHDSKVKYLRKKFAGVGIDPHFIELVSSERDKRVLQKEFEAVFIMCGVSAEFSDAFFTYFLRSELPFLIDPEQRVAQLYHQMMASTSTEEKRSHIRQISQRLITQGILIPLVWEKSPYFLRSTYEMKDMANFTEDISLWKVRRKVL